MMKSAVVIPAYNEEETIGRVLAEIPAQSVDRVIVVDNGSTDRTAKRAREAGAELVFEGRRGYGYACYAGFKTATDAELIVFMDGDGADNPEQIPKLMAPIKAGRADLVIGSRARGEAEPGALLPQARFGNWLAAQLMRVLYGLRVTDLGPFRAIRSEVLEALDMQEMTYGWPTEMMVKAAKRDYIIQEVPVDYRRRAGGKSKISGTLRGTILAGYFILGTTIKHVWSR
jgi:glycosyltransferase involved in cell wall biosynthesis